MAKSPLHELREQGQSVWIDDLSREQVESKALERMVRDDAVVGVTSNPTIFAKALSAGSSYDRQLRDSLAETRDPKELFLRLAGRDVAAACDVLRGVYDRDPAPQPRHRGAPHRDGFVSIEVDPTFAYDTEATEAEATRLHELIARPNLLVKIPATEPGLPAIEHMIAKGRSINVTLIFSTARYTKVAEAYIRGLERLIAAGGDASRVASVASFFVSRVDTETDERLDLLGGHEHLKGRLAIANAKLAYQRYKDLFAGERWDFLSSKGATAQRCLWASTSTKNAAYSDVKYVEELIGAETVNTMPEKTLRAFRDHGRVGPTLEQRVDEARDLLDQLAAAGIDYDDVTSTLERQGVQSFADSFADLLESIRSRIAAM
jgi:transaldolase